MKNSRSTSHFLSLPGTPPIEAMICFCLLLLLPLAAYGQKSKEQLEQEKRENLRKIAEAEKILTETESQRKVTIGQLNAINQQIMAREGLISALEEEIKLLDAEIEDLNIVVNALQSDLDNLKTEYTEMVYVTYKVNRGFNLVTFLFSSQTFYQLYMRLKYMEQYGEARRNQAQQIQKVTSSLNSQLVAVEGKRTEQSNLLTQQITENKKLVKLKDRQSQVVAQLNKKKKELRNEMAQTKKAIEKLDGLIADLIRAELEKNRAMSTAAVEDVAALTASFEQQKDKLPWPVKSGFITMKFGRQPHPVLKNIAIESTGIEIQTNKEEQVTSIFDGEVRTRAFLPGYNNVVIIKHGTYYTVYSKLKEVNVKKGQIVKAQDVIGTVLTNADGVSEVHFEIWKNTVKLDPEKWLVD
ncbi:MAG: murein hydrolase activator EnvC family protein [Cyclobacteriaceae bacterium]